MPTVVIYIPWYVGCAPLEANLACSKGQSQISSKGRYDVVVNILIDRYYTRYTIYTKSPRYAVFALRAVFLEPKCALHGD